MTRLGVNKVKPKGLIGVGTGLDWVGIGLGDWGLKGYTEFVYPKCWHFDNGASSKIDDVLAEDGGLLHVLPLAS